MGGMVECMVFKKGSDKIKKEDIPTSLWAIEVNDLEGKKRTLNEYKNNKSAFIFVNVACKCGLTKDNYTEFVSMYSDYRDKGLEILGFPCGQFMNQELSSPQEIRKYIDDHFNVEFPMFAKIEVNGENTHPLYKYLKHNSTQMNTTKGLTNIPWNFAKFLVDQDGNVVKYYDPKVKPIDILVDLKPLLKL
jgi:glutathione peroxidase